MSQDNYYCVDPQALIRHPHRTSTPHPLAGPALQTNGLIHSHSRAPQAPSYTPQEILGGTYNYTPPPTTSVAPDINSRLEYVPRSPRYAGYISQSHPPIKFSVGGRPGPFLEDILRNKITLDGAQDDIFGGAWRQTKWTFDWPGLAPLTYGIYCVDVNNRPLTRDAFAREIGANIGMVMQKARKGDQRYAQPHDTPEKWRLDGSACRFGDVRLFEMHYVHSVWVPVLVIQRS
ncbi:hypothetical protein BDZ89DRAFT_1236207 [Hymenopellis radicata]|nr:hypothetical protein BDZ89DRAFT_1236207 [Hymenopellis radicata]